MNLTGKQIIGVTIAVLSVLMVSTAQLQDLFGPTLAKTITSVAGLLNAVLGASMLSLGSQASSVQDASGVSGVKVQVDNSASPNIAALAMNPDLDNVAAKIGDENAVAQNAKGA